MALSPFSLVTEVFGIIRCLSGKCVLYCEHEASIRSPLRRANRTEHDRYRPLGHFVDSSRGKSRQGGICRTDA